MPVGSPERGDLVRRREGAAGDDEAVRVDQRDDDDALGGEQLGDARVGLVLGELVGELHGRLAGGPLAGVVDAHDEVDGPAVVAVDVVGDLDAGDVAALEGLADRDGPDEAGVVVDELLELRAVVVVLAVGGAAGRQRAAGLAGRLVASARSCAQVTPVEVVGDDAERRPVLRSLASSRLPLTRTSARWRVWRCVVSKPRRSSRADLRLAGDVHAGDAGGAALDGGLGVLEREGDRARGPWRPGGGRRRR